MKKSLRLSAVSVLSILPLAASGLALTSTVSAAGGTQYVGHGSIGKNTGCSSPGYNSVQAAVDAAAPGNTVYLCGGQFAEQVFVNKSITMQGDSTSGLTAVGTTFTTSTSRYPVSFGTDNLFTPQALLVVTGGSPTVNNLKISGPFPGNGGCAEDEYGILALGGNITLNNVSVLNVADTNTSLNGCQFGVGIQIGRQNWETNGFAQYDLEKFTATATMNNVTVSGYAKNGITVDSTGSSATINNSTITGFGRVNYIAQNGIQISRGAKGTVNNSTISNNAYTGAGWASSGGVLIYGGCGDPVSVGVTVQNNKLVNNDVGVYAVNYNADCNGPSSTPTKEVIQNNNISNNAVTNFNGYDGVAKGYQAGIDDVGNHDLIQNNTISGKGYAKEDDSKAFVMAIDTTSFPTISPILQNNIPSH